MSWIWQSLCSGKLLVVRDSRRQCLLAALSCELAWSRSDSPQPENAYGESERLGLYTRVTLNAASWVEMAKQTWRSRSIDPIFNNNWEYPRLHVWCKFGDSSPNLWRVIAQTTQISRILSENGQNDLGCQGQWPPLSIPAESIPDCMFGAIWWF